MLVNLVLTVISFTIAVIGVLYIILFRAKMWSVDVKFLLTSIFILLGILYFIFFNLAIDTSLVKDNAVLLWKLSIFIGIVSLYVIAFLFCSILNYKAQSYYLVLLLFIGLITSRLLFGREVVNLDIIANENFFCLVDPFALGFLIIYHILIQALLWGALMQNIHKIRENAIIKRLLMVSIFLFCTNMVHILYLITHFPFLRDLHLYIYLLGAIYVLYAIIQNPNFFIDITKKLYDFVLFHRSGILLFYYNFETGKEIEESVLKGTILIGINHILGNLKMRQNELSLIKMKSQDIILEYSNDLGYAILLTAEEKNRFINKIVHSFMNAFEEKYGNYLREINSKNQLIDVSHFKGSKELIMKYFSPYISPSKRKSDEK